METEYSVEELINKAMYYKDEANDLNLALKYASLATIVTYSPRADACCLMGEIYLLKGNVEWAIRWYKSALNNITMDMDEVIPDKSYLTIIPLIKLAFISHGMGEDEKAIEYYDAVLKLDPKNEIALKNKGALEANKNKKEGE